MLCYSKTGESVFLSRESPWTLHNFSYQSNCYLLPIKVLVKKKEQASSVVWAEISFPHGHPENDASWLKLIPKHPASDRFYKSTLLPFGSHSSLSGIWMAEKGDLFLSAGYTEFSRNCAQILRDSNKDGLQGAWMTFQNTRRIFSCTTPIYLNCFPE